MENFNKTRIDEGALLSWYVRIKSGERDGGYTHAVSSKSTQGPIMYIQN
jgi:hypothetical protein